VLLSVLAVVVVILTISAWRAGTSLFQSIFNAVLVLAVPGWVGYAMLFVVAYRVTVSDGRVRWSAVLRSGEYDVREMTSVWSRRPGLARLRFGNERSVPVRTGFGFAEFARQLTSDYPKIRLDTSRLDRRL
jgi:hypothetical protein